MISLTPDTPDALEPPEPSASDTLMALAHLHDTRQWAQVVEYTDAWLEARGTMPALACLWRAAGLQGIQRYAEAVPWAALACQAITRIDGPNAQTWAAARIGMGQAFARTGHTANALTMYRAALKIPQTDPYAQVANAHLRLCLKPGSWRRGWRDHEARIGTDTTPVIPGVPAWDGGATTGSVVVLHEQGIGDAVLFGRYLPWVAERSGHPVLWAGPRNLHRWVAGIPGVAAAIGPEEALLERVGEAVELTRGVAIVRSMSLAALHGTTPATCPPPQAPDLARLRSPAVVRVGVCWQGSAAGHHDFERTIPPETFALLWEPPMEGVEYVNLQYNTPSPDRLLMADGADGDVYEFARIVASCDLVVSVDTSTVHLAGSLGIPTLCLTPSVPDWRYPNWPHGTDTPWYPSVSVVRRDRADGAADQLRTARVLAADFVAALRGTE